MGIHTSQLINCIHYGHGFGNLECVLLISAIISDVSSILHASKTSWSCHDLVAPKTTLATSGCRITKAAQQKRRRREDKIEKKI